MADTDVLLNSKRAVAEVVTVKNSLFTVTGPSTDKATVTIEDLVWVDLEDQWVDKSMANLSYLFLMSRFIIDVSWI